MIAKKSIKIALSLLLINSLAFGASNLESGVQELGEEISKSMINKKKTKLAIIEFSDLGDNVNDLGRYLAEKLISELFKLNSEGFSIVERRQLAKVLREQKLSTSGLIDAKAMKKVGHILGVDALVTGSITDLGNVVEINARVISVETGNIIGSASSQIPKVGSVANLLSRNIQKVGGVSNASATSTTQKSSEKKSSNRFEFTNNDIDISYKKITKYNNMRVSILATYTNKTDKPLTIEIYKNQTSLSDDDGAKWINTSNSLLVKKMTIDVGRKLISKMEFSSRSSGTVFDFKSHYTVNGEDIVVNLYDMKTP